MSDKLSFGLETRLRRFPLDASYPQIADHTTTNTNRSDNARMNELALGGPAYQRAPIAPDPKGSCTHGKPSLREGGELCILSVEHRREHRITLHLSLS
jgi:hypothetical protein